MDLQTGTVWLVLSLGVGIIAEDLSYKFVDSNDYPVTSIYSFMARTFVPEHAQRVLDLHPIGSRSDMRGSLLAQIDTKSGVTHFHSGNAEQRITKTALGKELARYGAFVPLRESGKDNPVARVERWLIDGTNVADAKDLRENIVEAGRGQFPGDTSPMPVGVPP